MQIIRIEKNDDGSEEWVHLKPSWCGKDKYILENMNRDDIKKYNHTIVNEIPENVLKKTFPI